MLSKVVMLYQKFMLISFPMSLKEVMFSLAILFTKSFTIEMFSFAES